MKRLSCLILASIVALSPFVVSGGVAASEPVWYAGIDVGSKGIKVVALPIDDAGKPDLHRVIKKLPHQAVNNVTLKDLKDGKFRPAALEEAEAAIRDFFEQLTHGDGQNRLPIKPDHIWIVASSGLVKNRPTNFSQLEAAVARATGGARRLEAVSQSREMELLMRGAIPPADWDNAVHVDVGSGNVKCGYITPEHKPHVGRAYVADVELDGTVAYRQRIDEALKQANAAKSFRRFCKIAEEGRSKLADEVEEQIGRHPGLNNEFRRRVYLSGGSPFVIASLLHPVEMAKDSIPEVQVTVKELRDFIKKIENTEKVPYPSLIGLSDSDRPLAESQVREAADIFSDTKSLLAGAEILLGFDTALHWEANKKEIFFTKSGLVAWIVGFVVEERAKAARAAGPQTGSND